MVELAQIKEMRVFDAVLDLSHIRRPQNFRPFFSKKPLVLRSGLKCVRQYTTQIWHKLWRMTRDHLLALMYPVGTHLEHNLTSTTR